MKDNIADCNRKETDNYSSDLIQKTANKIIESIENVLLKELELKNNPDEIKYNQETASNKENGIEIYLTNMS